jgi:hypothetical protein
MTKTLVCEGGTELEVLSVEYDMYAGMDAINAMIDDEIDHVAVLQSLGSEPISIPRRRLQLPLDSL